jgi:hypothetical protein
MMRVVNDDYYILTFTLNQIKLQNTFTDKIPFQSKYWGFKSQAQMQEPIL